MSRPSRNPATAPAGAGAGWAAGWAGRSSAAGSSSTSVPPNWRSLSCAVAATCSFNRQNAQTSELIADCTTEGGRCYKAGQARSANAVQGVIRGYIAVQACLEATDTDAELERAEDRAVEDVDGAPVVVIGSGRT